MSAFKQACSELRKNDSSKRLDDRWRTAYGSTTACAGTDNNGRDVILAIETIDAPLARYSHESDDEPRINRVTALASMPKPENVASSPSKANSKVDELKSYASELVASVAKLAGPAYLPVIANCRSAAEATANEDGVGSVCDSIAHRYAKISENFDTATLPLTAFTSANTDRLFCPHPNTDNVVARARAVEHIGQFTVLRREITGRMKCGGNDTYLPGDFDRLRYSESAKLVPQVIVNLNNRFWASLGGEPLPASSDLCLPCP